VAPGADKRRLLRENVRRFGPPGADAAALAALERSWWDNTGRMKAEYSVMPRLFREGRVAIEGGGDAEAALGSGRPVIFLSSHIGNWEVLLTALCGTGGLGARFGTRIVAPHSVARNRFRRNLATRIRNQHGRLAFPPGPESARRFQRILAARAGHVVFLVDSLKDEEIASPRFGRPHPASSNLITAVRLAPMTDALLLPVHALRTEGARFRLTFGAPIDPRDFAAGSAGRAALADHVSDVMEAVILDHLEQWSNLRRLTA
jgi:KDO2-lipid IV(A) lauroyltransferase